ncbi:MAG: preprotein translocase subunit SecG [Candidatus Saccharibacteria bacterium]|nr:preprotein translocase subunit SecG [Patescibacteria group bacterium]
MKTFLQILLVIISILITIFVMLQSQKGGLGNAFGGEASIYRTKRGTEKFLFYGTMVLGVAFVACILGLLTIK